MLSWQGQSVLRSAGHIQDSDQLRRMDLAIHHINRSGTGYLVHSRDATLAMRVLPPHVDEAILRYSRTVIAARWHRDHTLTVQGALYNRAGRLSFDSFPRLLAKAIHMSIWERSMLLYNTVQEISLFISIYLLGIRFYAYVFLISCKI